MRTMLMRVTERTPDESPGRWKLRRRVRRVPGRPSDPRYVWDIASRAWRLPDGSERGIRLHEARIGVHGGRLDYSQRESNPSAAGDGFDSMLRRLYLAGRITHHALGAWVAEGLTWYKLRDRVRGTIEAEIFEDDLFAVFLAHRGIDPESDIIEPLHREFRCHLDPPASPKAVCAHEWERVTSDQGRGSVYAVCSSCGEKARQGCDYLPATTTLARAARTAPAPSASAR